MRVARINPPAKNMSMYSPFVNQWTKLAGEQLLAAQRFDELLTAADIQSSLGIGPIRAMATTVSNACRHALWTTNPLTGTEAWTAFIVAADRLAQVLPSQSFSARELRRIVSENSDLLPDRGDDHETD
jgi:hypothetical protein